MGLAPKFTKTNIRQFINRRQQAFSDILIESLEIVGEQFVANARSTNTYKDRTRNLRGSIAYIILKDGVQVKKNYNGDQDGQSNASKLIEEVSAKYPKGFALIVVAGMHYAAYVEGYGFDVLTGSSQLAEGDLKTRIRLVQQKIR